MGYNITGLAMTNLHNTIKTVLQKHWTDILGFTYFASSMLIIGFLVYDKYYVVKKQEEPLPKIVVEDTTGKRLETLEADYKKLTLQVKYLETKNEDLIQVNKALEKKQQVQISFNKRLCEYIGVITIDKKIIPRQCLSDYIWNIE